MKALKKALLAGVAVGALSTIVATSAFAASYADGKVSVETDLSKYEGQMTVLVLAKGADEKKGGIVADDILYIDQVEAGTGIFQDMGVKGGALANGVYIVKIGGENVDEIIVEEFKVGSDEPSYTLGDVDYNTRINEADAMAILNYCADLGTLTEVQELAADVDKNLRVNEADGMDILNFCADLPSYVGGTK